MGPKQRPPGWRIMTALAGLVGALAPLQTHLSFCATARPLSSLCSRSIFAAPGEMPLPFVQF